MFNPAKLSLVTWSSNSSSTSGPMTTQPPQQTCNSKSNFQPKTHLLDLTSAMLLTLQAKSVHSRALLDQSNNSWLTLTTLTTRLQCRLILVIKVNRHLLSAHWATSSKPGPPTASLTSVARDIELVIHPQYTQTSTLIKVLTSQPQHSTKVLITAVISPTDISTTPQFVLQPTAVKIFVLLATSSSMLLILLLLITGTTDHKLSVVTSVLVVTHQCGWSSALQQQSNSIFTWLM